MRTHPTRTCARIPHSYSLTYILLTLARAQPPHTCAHALYPHLHNHAHLSVRVSSSPSSSTHPSLCDRTPSLALSITSRSSYPLISATASPWCVCVQKSYLELRSPYNRVCVHWKLFVERVSITLVQPCMFSSVRFKVAKTRPSHTLVTFRSAHQPRSSRATARPTLTALWL